MDLFRGGWFKLHSGQTSSFKVDCDALSDQEIEVFAEMIGTRYHFGRVVGVPEGGIRLANALRPYANLVDCTVLIVDDVLTTGTSMEETKAALLDGSPTGPSQPVIQGVVLFARGPCPPWVDPVWTFWE